MKVETELLPSRQAKLTVEVEQERLQKELQAAARRISAKANIPGFRRGKAPYAIVQRYFGDETIFEEALEPLGQAVYSEALTESGLEPYAPGALEDVQRDPLKFAFSIPLAPEVQLGRYRDIRLKEKRRKVTDKDVEHALEHAQDDQATLEPVERPVEVGDVASLNLKGVFVSSDSANTESTDLGQDVFIDRRGARVLISKSATYPVPGFPAKIVGMSANENRDFEISLPKKGSDLPEDLRGKSIHFEVTCTEVFKREVPILDDEFARSLGDYVDLDDLRSKLRVQLEANAEEDGRREFLDQIFEKLFEGVVEVTYPSVVVDEQLDRMIEDFAGSLRRQGMNLDDYLKMNSTSQDELRESFRATGVQQVERGLVLGKISEVENIVVTAEDIDDEIQTRLLSFGAQASLAKPLFDNPSLKQSIAGRLLTDKTVERLIQIARGESPKISHADDIQFSDKPKRKPAKKTKSPK